MIDAQKFRRKLLAWYDANRRDLPWRKTNDPYRILVSEIMLQQTRVAAVIPYYERFLNRFPDAAALAAAGDDELLAAWAGLGYYSRARNLREAARQILVLGEFPRTIDAIRDLKGVGEYTAAAAGSIAFGIPAAAVDGNVLRVVARLLNDASDIQRPRTKAAFRDEAQRLLAPGRPGDFNQAMMELGATVCTSWQPACSDCPVAGFCAANGAGTARELPVKLRNTKKIQEEVTVWWVERDGKVLLRKRGDEESKLAGFWELPRAGEVGARPEPKPAGKFRHFITIYNFRYIVFKAQLISEPGDGFAWTSIQELDRVPVTTATRKAFRVLGVKRDFLVPLP